MIQSKRINGVDISYTIADPVIDDIYAAFKIGSTVKELGLAEKADVAMTVNFANNTKGIPIGRLIVEANEVNSDEVKTIPRDEIYMLSDRTIHMGKAPKGALWAVQGSPPLLRAGKDVIDEGIKRDQTGNDIWTKHAYRNAGGITSDGRYVGVRTLSAVSLETLRGIMEDLGCRYALNFDGGGSAYLWPYDNGWGRKMGASLNIKWGEVEQVEKPFLIIDPGHGGTDPGGSGNGIIEKLMTLAISLYQYNRFKELGLSVAITRTTDVFIDATPRATIVKNSGAKYCISNHINAATSTTAAGVEVIRSIHSDGKFATALMEAVAATGQPKRSTPVITKTQSDGQDWYFMQRLTGSVSTVTVEYGFCTNEADAARLKANWEIYAEAVVKAFCLFVGHKYTAPKTVVTPPVKPPVVTESTTFKDVPKGHFSESAIGWAKNVGLVGGYPDGTLGFGENITIERLLVILNRFKTLK